MEDKANEIIHAASNLFKRYGIRSISMEELSRQMGISKKTIYQHFADKNDLVEKTILFIMEEKGCILKELIQKNLNAIDELFAMFDYANELIRDHKPTLEFDLKRFYPQVFNKIRDFHRNSVLSITLNNLIKGKAEGYYRNDFDAQIIAKLHVLRIENLMHSDLITPEEIHSNAFYNEVFKYHIYGIISQKGHQFIEINYPTFYH